MSRTGLTGNRKKNRRRRICIAAALLLISVLLLSIYIRRDGFGLLSRGRSEIDEVVLTEVYDGDTIRVRLRDGREETVRLLMIDAPESVHPDEERNTEEGRRAAAFLRELLPKGTKLYLEYERGKNRKDIYGRTLAYVWLTDSTSVEPNNIKNNMVNAILLQRGHAVFHLYDNGNPINEKYRRVLEGIR